MRHGVKLAAGFLVAVLAVVVGAVAAGAILADGPPAPPQVENEQFEPGTALPQVADIGGEIQMESGESGERVVVDTAHNNDVTDRDLAPLTGALSSNGHEVRSYDGVQVLSLQNALNSADALVVINPEHSYTHEELDAVRSFVEDGGRVVVAMDPGSRNALSEGRGRLGETTIFSALGIEREAGYLYNGNRSENNYVRIFARPADESPLAAGVDRAVLPGASPVGAVGGRVALSTTDDTRLSTTEAARRYPVVVHDDGVAVLGDASFLRPENAYHADNNVLIGNLADFLVAGDKTGGPAAVSTASPDNATPTPDDETAGESTPDGEATTGETTGASA